MTTYSLVSIRPRTSEQMTIANPNVDAVRISKEVESLHISMNVSIVTWFEYSDSGIMCIERQTGTNSYHT